MLLLAFPNAPLILKCEVLTASCYLILSMFWHSRFSLYNEPFSPMVILKPMFLVAYYVNILYLAQNRPDLPRWALSLSSLVALISFVLADLACHFWKVRSYNMKHGFMQYSTTLRERWLIFFTVIYFGGWIWRVYAVRHGLVYGTMLAPGLEVTPYSNLLGTLGQVSTLAFAGVLVFSRQLCLITLLLLLEIGWKWIGGSKAGSFYVVLPALMVLHARGLFRLNTRGVALFALMVPAFLGSFVLIHEYRRASQRMLLDSHFTEFDPITAARNMQAGGMSVNEAVDNLARRLSWAEGLTTIMSGMEAKNVGSLNGRSYLRCMDWMVPRAVWQDKPEVSMGSWYARTFLGWALSTRSEAEITVWGEAFLNCGMVGALLIPAIWLIILQAIYIRALRTGVWGLLFLGAVYVIMMNALAVNVAVTVAALGQGLILTVLIVMVGQWFVSRPAKHWIVSTKAQ